MVAKKRSGSWPSDPDELKRNAREFLDAHMILSDYPLRAGLYPPQDKKELLPFGFQQISYNALTPPIKASVVCLAFSAELYLKALIAKREIDSRLKGAERHNLNSLFTELPDNDKQQLICLTRAYLERCYKQQTSEAEFYSDLCEVQKDFENWRYAHEFVELRSPSHFLYCLCCALDNILGGDMATS